MEHNPAAFFFILLLFYRARYDKINNYINKKENVL